MLSKLAEKALQAYGGAELWQKSKYIEAEVSTKGLLFTLKNRTIFNHAKIKMEIGKQFSKITPIGKAENIAGVINGKDVWLEDEKGNILSERKDARTYFPYGRRLFYWDDLDMAYFANYAFWNYFTLPKLLMNSSIIWEEKEDELLTANFPDTIETHSKFQQFIIDKNTGLLKQHNYTAEVVSKLAKATNVIFEHSIENEILYPSSRTITPIRKNGNAMSKPVLVDINVHKFILTT
jgi:hypothetical protein